MNLKDLQAISEETLVKLNEFMIITYVTIPFTVLLSFLRSIAFIDVISLLTH